jgi:hypothetical protein
MDPAVMDQTVMAAACDLACTLLWTVTVVLSIAWLVLFVFGVLAWRALRRFRAEVLDGPPPSRPSVIPTWPPYSGL